MKPRFLWTAVRKAAMTAIMICAVSTASAAITHYPYIPTNLQDADNPWTLEKIAGGNELFMSDNISIRVLTSSGTSNHWIFSPALKLKAGLTYKFTFTVYPEYESTSKCNAYVLTDNTSSASKLVSKRNLSVTGKKKELITTLEYVPEEACTVYFAVNDVTPSSGGSYQTRYTGFKVEEEGGLPSPNNVSGLTATPDAGGELSVALNWVNPESDTNGSQVVIKQVNISRNNAVVVSLTEAQYLETGAALSYVDAVPASGIYTYGVSVIAENGESSDEVKVITEWVGNAPTVTVPHEFDLTDNILINFWKFSAADVSNQFEISGAKLNIKRDNKDVNATATTPGIELSASKAYKFSFTGQNSNLSYPLTIALSTVNADGETSEIMADKDILTASTYSTVTESSIFTPIADGTYSIVITATGAPTGGNYYYNVLTLSDIKIEEAAIVPALASNLTAIADACEAMSVNLSWTNPTTSETGLACGNLKATIMRDGSEIETVDTAGESGTYTDNFVSLLPGYHTYSVVISNDNGASEAATEQTRSNYVGAPVELPYTADFSANPYLWTAITGTDNSFKIASGKMTVNAPEKSLSTTIMTPPMNLKEGQIYELGISDPSYKAKYALSIVEGKDADTESAVKLAEGYLHESYPYHPLSQKFTVEKSGAYRLVLDLTAGGTSTSKKDYSFDSFSVVALPSIPADPVDAKTAVVNKKVEISFTMPAVTTDGAPLLGALSAAIYRGNVVGETELSDAIATKEAEAGSTVTFSDANPVKGYNCYTIVLSNTDTDNVLGGTSAGYIIYSPYMGETLVPPFASDFTTDEGRAMWAVADRSPVAGNSFSFTPDNTLKVVDALPDNSSTNKNLDDWIFSPEFYSVTGYTFSIKFMAKGATSSSTYYEIYVGKAPDPESMAEGKKIAGDNFTTISGYDREFSATYTPEDFESDYTDVYEPDGTAAKAAKRYFAVRFGRGADAPSVKSHTVEVKSLSITPSRDITTDAELVETAATFSIEGNRIVASDSEASVEVYNAAGMLVARGTGSAEVGSEGIYIVRLATESSSTVTKVLIR